MCWANNLVLENDLGVLEVSLYTDINGIVIILGLGFFISLVNCFLILEDYPKEKKYDKCNNWFNTSGYDYLYSLALSLGLGENQGKLNISSLK